MQPGIAEDNLGDAPRGRVFIKDSLDIFSQGFKHCTVPITFMILLYPILQKASWLFEVTINK
jgi:hypothetical protein